MRQAMLDRSDSFHLEIHPTVASQTKSLRTMLSTHRDSRRIAVRKYPDELVLPVVGCGRAIVRFRKETDVVYLMNLISDSNYVPPDFASEVQNLAVYAVHNLRDEHVPNAHETLPEVVLAIQGIFPNLKRLYNVWLVVFQPKDEISDESITKYVHQYMVETYGQETGLEEDTRSLFCWPVSHIHPDFSMGKVRTRRSPEEMEGIGLEVWSMVQFWSKRRYRTYNKLRRLYLNLPSANAGDDQDSSNSYDDDDTDSDDFESEGDDDDDGTDSDEFESEGIDDDDVVELDG
ncbi:hypothetical protein E4U40_000522 [Claviceps sp. LM458 group G5]|nr:hypothetical protein E4U40_000522 [Claviceps sp. LM458 group G5]